MIIRHRSICSDQERALLKAYLSCTNVPNLAVDIEQGASVGKGEVGPTAQIGRMATFWSCLGGLDAAREHGARKFLVCHVLPTLEQPGCADLETLNTVRRYFDLASTSSLDVVITLVEQRRQLMICDGNKRVVACYERARQTGNTKLFLPVFVIALA